ncbi:hypothetical protein P4493_05235 [Bacillus thuringiensis]|jgi:hypothetical protein|uniref:Cysteine-rich protein n=3 Tax=Bacillus thuringiensis TaxID=1428 RepID=A0A0B5NLL8_BACTU|nr:MULTISPECIES: hypothetical protein [Bacillus]EAO52699.1 Cysteine-rich protein [Bacillus thuringiensis serovar israelensis ATCC 35646]MEC2536157.1 hypothetical protein [Bacillus cereus]MED1153601.1 hypothetical protein [Bacillus paranthracis]OUB09113.1 hypothetical protein BK708_31725 [Bacillus thuringiensis serovar yunnanensis]AFQ29928.1 hypothetical protein BTF1_29137 [Bacillus thuringiensis HD-789]
MICKEIDCHSKVRAKGYCAKHYTQIQRHGRVTPEKEKLQNGGICKIEGCNQKLRSRGLCSSHYYQHMGFYQMKKNKENS